VETFPVPGDSLQHTFLRILGGILGISLPRHDATKSARLPKTTKSLQQTQKYKTFHATLVVEDDSSGMLRRVVS
jgi:hypothetical protein